MKKIHIRRGGMLRRLTAVCACLMAASCSGDGTGAGGLKVRIELPGTVIGTWTGFTGVLICRPEMTVTATGEGHAVWTGGTSRLTAPYGTYDFTHSAEEVAMMVASADISAGQSLVKVLGRSANASFHIHVAFAYTVDGTGQQGIASGGYDCKAPA